MNQNLTEIIFLLDRSGSMSGLENDTIGGYNGFLKSQCKLGQTLLTTVLFDDRYEILHNGVDASNVTLTEKEYYTRGATALLDAIGKTILDVGFRLSHIPEENHPGKVIFVITTDGLENASKEFSYDQVSDMITLQQRIYHWEFIFMGANIDVAKESHKLGINPQMAFRYEASGVGTGKMFKQVDDMVYGFRISDAFRRKKRQ